MSISPTTEPNPFAAALRDQQGASTAFAFTADEAEELGLDADDDDDTTPAADDGTTSAAQTSDADLSTLTEGELFDGVFVDPQIDLLANIVDLARGWQLGSPWGALGKALGVAACDVPSTSFRSGMGSTRVPLNFLLGMVGDPGMGKGATMSAQIIPASSIPAPVNGVPAMGGAAHMYKTNQIRHVYPASGPAFVSEFFDIEMKDNGKGKEIPTPVQHCDAVWAEWNEVDSLTAKSRGVSGSTLDPLIRSVHTGEALGDKSISRSKDNIGSLVPAGTYRCIVVVGIQPDRAAAVLRDGGGGTLQRYIFLELADSHAAPPDQLFRIRCQLHRRLGLALPQDMLTEAPQLVVHGPSHVTVSNDVIMALLAIRHSVLTRDGSVAKEDTHGANNRLRLAAIYAGWKNPRGAHVVIDLEAWRWAGLVMEYSRRRRDEINNTVKKGETEEARRKGELWGVTKEAADAHSEQVTAVKVQALVLTLVEKLTRRPGQAWRDIKQGASKGQRPILEAALDLAEQDGCIVCEAGAYYAVINGEVQK